MFDPAKQAKACEFCGASAIVDYDETNDVIRPEGVMPFQVSEVKARETIRGWYGKLWRRSGSRRECSFLRAKIGHAETDVNTEPALRSGGGNRGACYKHR